MRQFCLRQQRSLLLDFDARCRFSMFQPLPRPLQDLQTPAMAMRLVRELPLDRLDIDHLSVPRSD
ncbi:MAG: hypothetical protein KDJ44_01420 [Rhodoblastus sp.]|nr:hypothetical protein [Rhodoblastus sp.]